MNAIKRKPQDIERDIREHEFYVSVLRELATDIAACQIRPFVVVGDHITYLREIELPLELTEALRAEAESIARLVQEYYE